jgi:hypothetical protein
VRFSLCLPLRAVPPAQHSNHQQTNRAQHSTPEAQLLLVALKLRDTCPSGPRPSRLRWSARTDAVAAHTQASSLRDSRVFNTNSSAPASACGLQSACFTGSGAGSQGSPNPPCQLPDRPTAISDAAAVHTHAAMGRWEPCAGTYHPGFDVHPQQGLALTCLLPGCSRCSPQAMMQPSAKPRRPPRQP